MDEASFEAAVRREGFGAVERGEKPPQCRTDEHAHDFDVAALVLQGAITLTWQGQSRTYAAGERFGMAAGTPHAETVGPEGVQYLVACRPLAGQRRDGAPK